jgi:soluble lytic murein transglycosylase
MQLMPSTFEWLTNDILNENLSAAMLKDPGVNIRYGTFLLSRLYGQYGNWKTVFAAYNAGMGNVNKWLEDERYSDGSGNLTFIPFAETRRYVELADKSAGIYKRLYYDKGD